MKYKCKKRFEVNRKGEYCDTGTVDVRKGSVWIEDPLKRMITAGSEKIHLNRIMDNRDKRHWIEISRSRLEEYFDKVEEKKRRIKEGSIDAMTREAKELGISYGQLQTRKTFDKIREEKDREMAKERKMLQSFEKDGLRRGGAI